MNYPGVAQLLYPPPAEQAWKDQAACRGINHFTEQKISEQLAVCRGGGTGEGDRRTPCPVIAQCLELGLSQPLHVIGRIGFVFGGIQPRELRQLQREQRATNGGIP